MNLFIFFLGFSIWRKKLEMGIIDKDIRTKKNCPVDQYFGRVVANQSKSMKFQSLACRKLELGGLMMRLFIFNGRKCPPNGIVTSRRNWLATPAREEVEARLGHARGYPHILVSSLYSLYVRSICRAL